MARHTELPDDEHVERRAERLATSYPTGTPPRGNASTITSFLPAYCASCCARSRPASDLSRKRLVTIR